MKGDGVVMFHGSAGVTACLKKDGDAGGLVMENRDNISRN
jgi:pyruvoyl-dependent arginine decarboxylase (PvlArgDC)